MKTLTVAALVFALLVVPNAEAKTCFGYSCNYIDAADNNHFSDGCDDWTCSSVSIVTSTTCSNGSNVAQIGNYAVLTRGPFTVDNTYTNAYQIGQTTFKLTFKLQLPGDTDNFYDELTVKVRDNTTGAEETTVFHGSSTAACSSQTIWLSNNYSNHSVTVTFTGGSLISHPWQVDDVNFFAYY